MTYTTAISVLVVSTGICLTWYHLPRMRGTFRHTTLLTAYAWAVGAAALWTLTWVFDSGFRLLPRPMADHLWYASAVASLCPAIAVLGARRPGIRVWNWFILLPMLFALGWPVLTLLLQGSDIRGLQLETPQLVAYLLVLVMGAGNYVGTRYTPSSLLYIASNASLVVSSSSVCPHWLSDRWWVRSLTTVGMVLAVLFAASTGHGVMEGTNRFDKLWLDFFDTFGIVWGRRIQDRVNYMATKEAWPARLELHGIHWQTPANPQTEARIEHTFRWLLRRFVDPEWIDERLGANLASGEITALGADS